MSGVEYGRTGTCKLSAISAPPIQPRKVADRL
jgi:hypothetical protein